MIENRSAPPGAVVPSLVYRDVAKAIPWLCGAFGFIERLRTPPGPGGTIHHAQLATGQGCVILTGRPDARPEEFGETVMVRVQNIDKHCEKARQFGARIILAPDSKDFGERQYNAEDLEGRRWAFTESVQDVAPENWGAIVSDLRPRLLTIPRPFVCYLEVPSTNPHKSAAFFEKVFGWNIRHRESGRPSFDDASGDLSGAFVQDRAPAKGAGILPSIWVDDIDMTAGLIEEHGGEVLEMPRHDQPDSNCWIAKFREPGGSEMRLYQEHARSSSS